MHSPRRSPQGLPRPRSGPGPAGRGRREGRGGSFEIGNWDLKPECVGFRNDGISWFWGFIEGGMDVDGRVC